MAASKKSNSEPVMIVRPAIKSLGLDYLHVSLIVLVIILIGLAFALSTFKGVTLQSGCSYGTASNGICVTPQHTSSQAIGAAEQVIASYELTNSSLSLLPYYSEPNLANVSYLNNQSEWLVVVPYIYPGNVSQTFYLSMLFYDSNLSLVRPFLQIPKSPYSTQNKALAYGVLGIAGKTACKTVAPITVYSFIDPYAPGAINGLYSAINASNKFRDKINMSYEIIFSSYAANLYKGYGVNRTQQNGLDLWCATRQPRFSAYLANYSLLFTGVPLDNGTLNQIAIGSGLNMTEFTSCLTTAPQKLDAQGIFASYYNIQTTPLYVVNCQYQTIPQTLNNAIQYSLTNNTG